MKDVTIVIPTYNRKELVKKTLLSLEKQTYPKNKFEVIVIDDGGTDGTEKVILELKNKLKLNLSYFKQSNKGPASARNVGIKNSRGEYIYFVDDDVELSPVCLAEHMKSHKKADIAVLGYTIWSDKIEVTDFMNFLAPNGLLFNYANIKNPNDCGYGCFWTNNISLHKHWLKEDLFDEKFYPEKGKPIMEDVELAYRLSKKGLRIVLNKKALSYHYHQIKEKGFFERGKLAGQIEVLFYKKHNFNKKLNRYRKIVPLLCLISKTLFFISPFLKVINKGKCWKLNMLKARFDGINKGLKLYNKKEDCLKGLKVFYIHNFFMDFRNPLFEKLHEKFDLIMLMTRETISADENMFQLNYRKRPKNINYKIFSHSTFFSKYSIAWGVIPYLLFKDYDVVISIDPHVSETYLAFFISKLRRKKFILWSETFDWKRAPRAKILEPLVKLVSRYSDACVVAGTKAREYLIKKGASREKVFIGPHSANCYTIKKRVNDPDLKNKKIILYLSRIVPYKGLDILIQAFAKIEKDIKDSFLLVAGKGSFEQESKKLATELNINNIKFIGPVDKEHIGFYYSICDVFVLPSTFRDYDAECWGLVLNEAMAFGKPIISTDAAGGAYDLIKNGVNGFRIKHGNAEELYHALKKILTNDSLRKKMGKESKKLIENKFNYNNMAKGFEEAVKYTLLK